MQFVQPRKNPLRHRIPISSRAGNGQSIHQLHAQQSIRSRWYMHPTFLAAEPISNSEDKRTYRFHLSQRAHVKGSFSARGNVSVYIAGGYYSSDGEISSDSIDVTLSAGTYEVIVSARQILLQEIERFCRWRQEKVAKSVPYGLPRFCERPS